MSTPHVPRWLLASALMGSMVLGLPLAPAAGSGAPVLEPDEVLDVQPMATVGGITTAVAASGQRALVGVGPRLQVLDLSDPSAPRALGAWQRPAGAIRDVLDTGALALVVDNLVGLAVVDLADPAAPTQLSAEELDGAVALGLRGDVAYVLVDQVPPLLVAFDVTDPAAPRWLGELETTGDAAAMAVAGDYAYVAAGIGGGLRVIQVADPGQMREVGTLIVPARDVAVVGDRAFVAADTGGLVVADVSDPTAPEELAAFPTTAPAATVTADGTLAYVGMIGGLVSMIEVADPTAPVIVGSYLAARSGTCGPAAASDLGPSVAVADGVALVAALDGGLQVVDVSRPAAATLIAAYAPKLPCAMDVAADGRTAFVAGGADGLQVVDATAPDRPVWLGELRVPDAERVAEAAGTVYVAGDLGLHVVDVRFPEAPVLQGSLYLPGPYYDLSVSGHVVALAGASGLSLVDARDPSAPILAGQYMAPHGTWAVALQDSLAYVASDDGLHVLDIARPSEPRLVGRLEVDGTFRSLASFGRYVLMTDVWNDVIDVVDVSQPTLPVWLTDYPAPPSSTIALDGDLALAAGTGLAQFLDLADVSDARAVGDVELSGTARGAALGDLAYLATGAGGLVLLEPVPVSEGIEELFGALDAEWPAPQPSCVSSRSGGAYSYRCTVATGHTLLVELVDAEDPEQALRLFQERRQSLPLVVYAGHPSFSQTYDERPDDPSLPMRHRQHVWQAGRFVVTVEAFDDSPDLLAPPPTDVSDRVLAAAGLVGLFGPGTWAQVAVPLVRSR